MNLAIVKFTIIPEFIYQSCFVLEGQEKNFTFFPQFSAMQYNFLKTFLQLLKLCANCSWIFLQQVFLEKHYIQVSPERC